MTTAIRATSLTVALALAICLVIFAAATTHATNHCEFRLGFKTLRDLIGHEIVGECLENEHYNAIGDSNQRTTGGLMAWRKADNWTAFTDGYRTWINGPNGLVQRLNSERFPWEADYAPGGGIATPVLTAIPQQTPLPVPTVRPTPRPVPTAQPQRVDPRLQPVLDLIATTAGGELVVADFEKTEANLTYGNLQTAGHYDPNTNTIVFDEGMSTQPLAVLAFILVHEIQHAQFPWTEYGQDCFRGELMADLNAMIWWQGKYGDAGHPDTGNEFVRYFNYELSLWTQDVRDGTNLWRAHILEKNADLCGAPAVAPTPIPTPTPRPTPVLSAEPGVYDPVEVERFFSIYQGYASAALAEIYDVNPRGAQASMLLDLFAERIEVLPMMYMMHVWATDGPESGHPLLNIKRFTLAYFKDYRHYARLTTQWLDDLAAKPCAALPEEREWVIWIETYWPGALKATIEMSYQPDWLVQHAVKAALQEAARELADNPNAITERYGCG